MKNLKIGARLGLAFAVVLVLLAAMTVVGIMRLQSASAKTEALVAENVRNERLVAEWQKVVEVNAARTTAAYMVSDPEQQKSIEAQMKAASGRATEIQDLLAKLLTNPAAPTRRCWPAARPTSTSARPFIKPRRTEIWRPRNACLSTWKPVA